MMSPAVLDLSDRIFWITRASVGARAPMRRPNRARDMSSSSDISCSFCSLATSRVARRHKMIKGVKIQTRTWRGRAMIEDNGLAYTTPTVLGMTSANRRIATVKTAEKMYSATDSAPKRLPAIIPARLAPPVLEMVLRERMAEIGRSTFFRRRRRMRPALFLSCARVSIWLMGTE